MAERLYRSRDDRMLAGVAGGVAEMLDADPSLVRVVWAVLTILTGGLALVVYVVMAIVVPEAPPNWGAAPMPGPGSPAQDDTGSASASEPDRAHVASDREARREARRARRAASGESTRAGLVGGLILIGIGAFFLVRQFIPAFDWDLWWPIGVILLGGLLVVLALVPGRRRD